MRSCGATSPFKLESAPAFPEALAMSHVPSPQKVVPVLSYAGPIVPQRPAFNARRAWTWKGEHLFRDYLTPAQAWFIRIAGAQSHAYAYQGGLLGGLIAMWANKRR